MAADTVNAYTPSQVIEIVSRAGVKKVILVMSYAA